MSDTTIPTGGTTPAPPTDPPVDNAAFARMRQALDAANTKAAALEAEKTDLAAKLKTHEDASKTELERLQEQAKEAERLRDENGRFASATQKLYDDALALVPEDKRQAVADLSANGNYAERYLALQKATALIGTAPAPSNAGTAATPTRGTQPGDANPPPLPKTAEGIGKIQWGEALRGHPVNLPPGLIGTLPAPRGEEPETA